jgi:UDP-glucose 4-epimerase
MTHGNGNGSENGNGNPIANGNGVPRAHANGNGSLGGNGHVTGNGNGNGHGNGFGSSDPLMFPEPLRVLITGGAGFIGSHLAESLIARGASVTAIDDLSTGRYANIAHLEEHPAFRFVYESVTSETVMDRLVSECNLIFHLAAAVGVNLIIKSPVQTIETNVLGTEAVLRLSRRYQKKILFASTSEIYGKSDNHPYQENDDRVLGPTTRGRWAYAESKALDEFLALAYHKEYRVPVVICRLFNTVGPRQTDAYGMVIPRLVKQAVMGQPLTVYDDGLQSRCFCHVHDVVRALTELALCPGAEGEIFNVGGDREITILDLARQILRLSESDSPIEFVPYAKAYASDFEDMRRRVPNIRKIRDLIRWEPRIDLERTLREVIAEFRVRAEVKAVPAAAPAAAAKSA